MLKSVEFHVGVAQPLEHCLRILRKARLGGVRVLVAAPAPTLKHISSQLWSDEESSFNVHATVGQASDAALQRSPVWLAQSLNGAAHEPVVVVNLGQDLAQFPETVLVRLQRLVEVVGVDAPSAQAARQRWRQYAVAGLHPAKVFDGGAGGGNSSSSNSGPNGANTD